MFRGTLAQSLLERLGYRPGGPPPVPRPALEAAVRHRSFDSMSGVLAWMLGHVGAAFGRLDLEGKAALEIGTGRFFTHPVGLYVCGCEKVVSVDKYRQLDQEAMVRAFERPVLARRFLSPHAPVARLMRRMREVTATGLDLDRLADLGITYRAPFDLTATHELDGAFDFAMSYTVLEHVPPVELPALLNKTVKVLRPGGVCAHFVDLEDHLNAMDDPFRFLADDSGPWDDEKCFRRGNRMRFSAWRELLDCVPGIDWRLPDVVVRDDVPLPERLYRDIRYRDETDLRTTGFVLVGRRR